MTKHIMNHRVVITGIGMCTPLGLDTASTWNSLIRGQSGIGRITHFDPTGFVTTIAGEVKGFEATNFMSPKDARRMDRFSQLAVAASREALSQSRLTIDSSNAETIGVIIGSGMGGISTHFQQTQTLLAEGPSRISPLTFPLLTPDMAAGQVSIVFGAKGPNFCVSSACASGADSIGIAFEKIQAGNCSVVIAGGAEACITPIAIAGFNALKALSKRNDTPEGASRPFDASRDGFVMSEGAAILILEKEEFARERGAKIIAEVVSYGACVDAHHITQPSENGEGSARSMRLALSKAGLQPNQINYINAHGTSTVLNDAIETQAIKSVFGEYAHSLAISSTKSMTGHMIGAAGAAEAAFCALAISNGILPPTINLENHDDNCDLDYIPNKARPQRINYAMSNSFGFGGHNSILIIGRHGEAHR